MALTSTQNLPSTSHGICSWHSVPTLSACGAALFVIAGIGAVLCGIGIGIGIMNSFDTAYAIPLLVAGGVVAILVMILFVIKKCQDKNQKPISDDPHLQLKR